MNKVNLMIENINVLSYSRDNFQLIFYATITDEKSNEVIDKFFDKTSTKSVLIKYDHTKDCFNITSCYDLKERNQTNLPIDKKEINIKDTSKEFTDYTKEIENEILENYKNDTNNFNLDKKLRFYIELN